jgi:hypothetical protein
MTDEIIDQLVPSNEKFLYSQFIQKHVAYKLGRINHINDLATLQLPNNSVLHMLDHLLEPDDISVILDVNNPLIKNETFQMYLDHFYTIPSEDDPLFPVTDTYRFLQSRVVNQTRAFFKTHPKLKRMPSIKGTLLRTTTLSIFNCDPLFKLYVTGRMVAYRKFDIVLRSVLKNISTIEGKHNYLYIPLSTNIYNKPQFQRAFKVLDTTSVRFTNDMSFFFLVHFLALTVDASDVSLFKKLEQHQLDTLNVIFDVNGRCMIFNLGDLISFIPNKTNYWQTLLRIINTLKLLQDHDESDLNAIPDDKFDQLVDQKAVKEEDEHPEEESPILPEVEISKTIPIKGLAATPDQDLLKQKVKEEVAVINSPIHLEKSIAPKPLIQHIDERAKEHVTNNQTVSEKAKPKLITLAEKYKQVELGGKSIEEHLSDLSLPPIEHTSLDFLKDSVPDVSMISTKLTAFDRTYVKEMLVKDMAATLVSFAAQGMFLTDIEENDEITQMDRVRHYKALYSDGTGRKHKVVFKFPILDDDGVMLVNGIESRMIKQQVNLPICKVSPTRVSLASNYNKALVERTSTSIHNFADYISKYINALISSGEDIKVTYGTYAGDVKVPYDYNCLATNYSKIEFKDFKFDFNYPNRLIEFSSANESYFQPNSTSTSNGVTYSITTLIEAAKSLPIVQFKVSDLAWNIEEMSFTEKDEKRIANADLTAPVLVSASPDGELVLDGLHRLVKAVREKVKTLPGHFISKKLLEQHRLTGLPENKDSLKILENTFGVYCGKYKDKKMFYGHDNLIRYLGDTNVDDDNSETIVGLLSRVFPKYQAKKVPSEWTELQIQDRNFPLAFVLGFRLGINNLFKKINIDYKFVPKGEKYRGSTTDIFIPFKDGNIWINRYPLEKSLIAVGFLKFDTSKYNYDLFNHPDTYYQLLQNSGISMNYLKGITSFFNLFMDPITRDVLQHMHEPTEVGDLLLRASQMLSTLESKPASSMANHRIRGYERFNSILYNRVSRALATYQNQRVSKKAFSINPNDVFQSIMQDNTIQITTDINPMHDIKTKSNITSSGMGGRTATSFVVRDRVFTKDAVGIVSESTPDNSKVAFSTYLSANPRLANMRGMLASDEEPLQPAEILSSVSMLLPFSVNDDGKRSANWAALSRNAWINHCGIKHGP